MDSWNNILQPDLVNLARVNLEQDELQLLLHDRTEFRPTRPVADWSGTLCVGASIADRHEHFLPTGAVVAPALALQHHGALRSVRH